MNKSAYNTHLDMARIDGEQLRAVTRHAAFRASMATTAAIGGASGLGPEDLAIAVQNAVRPSNESAITLVDTAYAARKCDVTPVILAPNGSRVEFKVGGKTVGSEQVVNGQAKGRIVGDCTHENPPVIEAQVITTGPAGRSDEVLRFPDRATTTYRSELLGPTGGSRQIPGTNNPGEFPPYDLDGRTFLDNPWQDFKDLGRYLGRTGFVQRTLVIGGIIFVVRSIADSAAQTGWGNWRAYRPVTGRLGSSMAWGAAAELAGRWFGFWGR